jgi:gluconolactonase
MTDDPHWQPSLRYPDPAIVALDPSFRKYHLPLSAVERLYHGTRWGEGPVWLGDGALPAVVATSRTTAS